MLNKFKKFKFLGFTDYERLEHISDEEYYLGDRFKEHISNSKGGLISPYSEGSPEKYLKGFDQGPSDAFKKGTFVHQLILERDKYTVSEVTSPSAKLGLAVEEALKYRTEGMSIYDSIKAACQTADYYKKNVSDKIVKQVLAAGLPYHIGLKSVKENELIIPSNMRAQVLNAVKSIRRNQKAMSILERGADMNHNEDVLIAKALIQDDEGNVITLPVKCKLDNWSYGLNTLYLNDLKTTGKPVFYFSGYHSTSGFVEGSYHKFCYCRQVAMYGDLLYNWVKQTNPIDEFLVHIITVEVFNTSPTSKVFQVSNQSLEEGRIQYQDFLKRIAFHDKYGYNVDITNGILDGPSETICLEL